MDRIRALYKSMRNPERKYLRTFLTAFHGRGDNKSLDLLDLIEKNTEITQDNAASILYDDPKSKAFIMLKSRLYDRMLESLMMSTNPSNSEKEVLKEPGFEKMEMRKLMIYNFLLRRKGLINLAEEVCERGMKICREYEYPDLELDFLGTLRVYYATSQSEKYEQVIRDMDDAFRRYELDMITYNNWNHYRKKFAMKSSVEGPKQYLEEAIPKFEESVRQLGTSNAKYYLFMMKINYFHLTRKNDECREQIIELLSLIKNSKRLNNMQGIGVAYTHLAMLELTTFNLEKALDAADKAAEFNNKNTHNYMISQIARTFILLHMGKLKEAEKQIIDLETDITHEIYSFNWAVCNYIKSCLAFIEKDFVKAWLLLQEVSGLNFDKSGWITGIRIFEIMVLIEKNDNDLATLRLDALRKHIQKHAEDERANLIYKLLNNIEKQSFLFDEALKKEAELLEELDNVHQWTIAGHETIRFEKWYQHKRKLTGSSFEATYLVSAMNKPKTNP